MKNYPNIRSIKIKKEVDLSNPAQHLSGISDEYWIDITDGYIGEQYDKSVYEFNGTNSYIDTNQIAVSLVGEVSIFAKVQSSGCLISNRTSSNNYFEVDLGSVGSSLVEVHLKESPNNYTLSSQFINDGEWHHISVEYTGTELSIYIDNVLDSTISGLTNITSNFNNVLIGTNNNNGHVLEGYLSDFEWKDDQGNTLIHYKMEEKQGNIAYDSSGLENHGTLYNILYTEVREPILYNYTNEEGYNIDNGTILPKVEGMVKVEDYPWNWITQDKYLLYKGNYFKPSENGTLLQGDQNDYDSITDIDFSSQNLTTDFTNTLLSKFINLQTLYCNDNNINVLDVSNLVNLTVLYCVDNNISVLDVSNLVNLESLNCESNNINVLDISNLVNLTYLSCVDNNISVLDIYNLVNLNYLNCASNNINVLGISNLVNLTDLSCQNNNISVLDIYNLVNITFLNCANNNISVLDLSNLQSVDRLFCQNNQLDAAANNQILIDLNGHGQSDGFLNTSIYGTGSLSHEAVSSGLNLLDKNWTIIGLPLNYLLNDYSGAAAAYSLYRLNTAYTGPAITVRRDSDNSVQDIGFVNGILDTNTLSTFCTTPVNKYTSDFSTSEDLIETNGIGSAANTIGGVSDAYKLETVASGNGIHQAYRVLTNNQTFNISFDYYIPSTNNAVNEISVGFINADTITVDVVDSWQTANLTLQNGSSSSAVLFRAAQNGNVILNVSGDVFYLKNIVINQVTSNGYVTKWYDQSGNGYDVTQTIASRQPQIFDSVNGVVTIDGKPAIYSNEDYLENLTKPASASSTAYIVHKGDTGVTSNVSIVGFPANGYSAHIGLYYWGTDVNKPFGFNSWNNDSFGYSNGKADFESHSLWTGLFKEGIITTNGVRLFKDGVEKSLSQVKGTSNNRTIEDGIYIGKGGTISGNQEGNGYYQEIIVYDNELTNKLPIENNINDRYQLYWSGATQRLLDTYSGATAAYSLEAINAGYTGAIIQVRRDSDNTVLNIGANYDGSLDVDKLTNFCNGANGFVTIWYDQSNSNNNLTQNTASAQPKIYDSVTGVITENGKPAIYTDGIDDELTSDILSLSNPTTQFFVFKTLVNAINEYVGGLYNGQNTASALQGTFSGDNLFLAQQGVDFPPSVPHNQRQLLITAKSSTIGTDWQLFKNGGEITNSGENIGTATGNKIILGNRNTLSFFGENYLQEYILYNSDETGNRTEIEDNINQRYNIYWDGSQLGLLDAYPNAAAAYSLEALNSQYTGAIIQVRRSSDNTVLNIYARYDGSLNVAALEDFCQGTDGFVTTWYDQSGNGVNAVQTTASSQPKIFDSTTGVILDNDKPSISFEGLNHFIDVSSLSQKSRLDIYFVVDTNDNSYLYPNDYSTTSRYGFVAGQGLTSTGKYSNYGNPDLYVNNVLFTGSTRDDVYNFLNGYKLLVHQNAQTLNWLNCTFGQYNTAGSFGFKGHLSELIAYDTDQSGNRTGIETNINSRYDIY